MTPYPDPMLYYDIHTHQPAIHPEDIAIVSVDLRKPFVPDTLRYSVGVHPWYADIDHWEETLRLYGKVREYANLPTVTAIGETGLDKITAKTTKEFQFQRMFFIGHARLAEMEKKIIIIHCVKAWDELLSVHKALKPSTPWIVHGFRGKKSMANRLLDAGLYLSFGLHYSIDALKAAWENHRLLAETDDNQINIRDVYHRIASDLNISENELGEEIEDFCRIYV